MYPRANQFLQLISLTTKKSKISPPFRISIFISFTISSFTFQRTAHFEVYIFACYTTWYQVSILWYKTCFWKTPFCDCDFRIGGGGKKRPKLVEWIFSVLRVLGFDAEWRIIRIIIFGLRRGDGSWGKKGKTKIIPGTQPKARTGWPKRLRLVQATPLADFAVLDVQLCSTITTIFSWVDNFAFNYYSWPRF